MVVTPAHFTGAMQKCQPSSLRDKAVEIPDVSWKDVGGLLDVKREMTETLQARPRLPPHPLPLPPPPPAPTPSRLPSPGISPCI